MSTQACVGATRPEAALASASDTPRPLRIDWRIPVAVAAALTLLFTIQNYLSPSAAALDLHPRTPSVDAAGW